LCGGRTYNLYVDARAVLAAEIMYVMVANYVFSNVSTEFLTLCRRFLQTPKMDWDRGDTVAKVCATNRKVAGSIPDAVIGFFR
jgi:hypothetical protein